MGWKRGESKAKSRSKIEKVKEREEKESRRRGRVPETFREPSIFQELVS